MKRLLTILLLFSSGLLFAQETPPTGLKSISNQFYISLADSSIWQNKGTPYGWQRVARYKELTSGLLTKADITYVDGLLATKVDKVVGKQLSTEDYTTAEKNSVNNPITGTGASVRSTGASLVAPYLGTPLLLVGTNITGTASGLSIGGNAASASSVPWTGVTGKPTANSPDAFLLARANHTGTQTPGTIVQDASNRFVTDTEKSAWNSKQAALGFTPENAANKGVANGYASLNSLGKIPGTQIPALALVETYVVNSQTAMLELIAAEQGDVAIRTDLSKTFILTDNNYSTFASWKELLSPVIPNETDPIWGASASAGITSGNISSWNAKQTALSGTGFVKSAAGTISYVTDNSTNWNTAFSWGNHAGRYVDLSTNQIIGGIKTFTETLKLSTLPIQSVGDFEIITRNTSTGNIERVNSTNYLTPGGSGSALTGLVRLSPGFNQTGDIRVTGDVYTTTGTFNGVHAYLTGVVINNAPTYTSGGYSILVKNTSNNNYNTIPSTTLPYLPLTGGTLSGDVWVESTGNTAWTGKTGVKSSAGNKSVFLGVYENRSLLVSHNYNIDSWMPLYINTADGITGQDVYLSASNTLYAGALSASSATLGSRLTTAGGNGNGVLINPSAASITLPTGLSMQTGFNVGYISNYNALGSLADLYYQAARHIFNSSVTATGFFESSDLRYKDIVSRTPSLSGFDMVTFKWKPELNRDSKLHYGYIAQEVKKVMPDQVQADENGMLSVNYTDILVQKIADLEQRILELEKK